MTTMTSTLLKAWNGKPREKTAIYSDRDGLAIHITPKGKISFKIRYQYKKVSQTVGLGNYPLMSLQEARETAIKYKKLIADGINPKTFKLEKIHANVNAITFDDMYESWVSVKYASNPKQKALKLAQHHNHVKPLVGDIPTENITLKMWLSIIEPLAREKPATAGIVLNNVRNCHKWAIKKLLIKDYHPLRDFERAEDFSIKINVGTRTLDNQELIEIFKASRQVLPEHKQLYLKLLLVFGCRRHELADAKKTDFDLTERVWTLKQHKTEKSQGPITRPIIPAVALILRRAFNLSDNHYVFKGTSKDHLSSRQLYTMRDTINRQLKNHGVELPAWRLHDLRRTFRTRCSKLADFTTAEKMLGHKLQGHYDHDDYIEKMTEAYKKWFDIVESLDIEAGRQLQAA